MEGQVHSPGLTRTRVQDLMRPHVWKMDEYAAPEPPEELASRLGMPSEEIIKLDQNENPYGCSPRVFEALSRCRRYHIYTDPLARESRALLESYMGVSRQRIIVGNGSDELIEILARLFLLPGDRVMSFTPTFGYYPVIVATVGAEIVGVPRDDDWHVDVEAGLNAMDDRTKMIVVASPNNPTGTTTPPSSLGRLLDTGRLVIADEAYFEFSGETALSLIDEYDNLVVLRTFSKWAGLAGLRLGYGIFPEWLIPQFQKVKPPYNLNVAAQVALRASLEDIDYLHQTVAMIKAERERLAGLLTDLGYLQPWPSQANFILARVLRGDARAIWRRLEQMGILVRYYGDARLRGCLRFSIGTPEQDDRLVEVLRHIGEDLT